MEQSLRSALVKFVAGITELAEERDDEVKVLWRPDPRNQPQCDAYHSAADVVLYGGSPGGGKSDLLLGVALTQHQRSFFAGGRPTSGTWPSACGRLTGWQLSIGTLFGGFVFGLGAAINGACAFSTLARLADGQLAMLGTLGGFVLGILACLSLVGSGWLPAPSPSPSMVGPLIAFAVVINLLLIAWVCYEGVCLWRTRRPQRRILDLLLARQYRLSSAAMLIGLANGGLYLVHGAWGYTETLHQTAEAAVSGGNFPTPRRGLLFAAVPLGMVLSTWQRGSVRVDWRPQFGWIRNIVGGILMGLGAALIPGGNDALVLYAIPSFSPQAIPSYLAMTLGIASALMAMRFVLGIETRVECRGDICIAEAAPRPSAFPQSARLTS